MADQKIRMVALKSHLAPSDGRTAIPRRQLFDATEQEAETYEKRKKNPLARRATEKDERTEKPASRTARRSRPTAKTAAAKKDAGDKKAADTADGK